MHGLLLIYNVFLIILYCVPLLLAFLIYCKGRQNIYLYTALLFAVFALDEIVICLTEFIPWFSSFYKRIMFTAPTFKTIVYFLSFLCMIKIVEWILHCSLPIWLYIGLVGLILFLLFIPGMKDSSTKLWLYYTACSIFSIILGIYGLYHYRKIPNEQRTASANYLHHLLLLMVIAYISVICEDSITLFNPDSILYRNTRSISEDCFRITVTIMMVIFLIRKIFALLESVPENAENIANELPVSDTDFNMDSNPIQREVSKDDSQEYSKFYLFCKEYMLTPREQDIMLLLLDNKSNTEISEELVISLGTAKTHIHNIYSKTDVKKRQQLIETYKNFDA
ncbi:MAG: helix-turn-helix transcriptional regulator [Hespellia sp.]|nr:helix-turn-helix transcriptional regulator [Hespellia sp.]